MPISRVKSCDQCRTAKSRCSLSVPCTRCRDRNIPCQYRLTASPRTEQRSTHHPRPVSALPRSPRPGAAPPLGLLPSDLEPVIIPEAIASADAGGEAASLAGALESFNPTTVSWGPFGTPPAPWPYLEPGMVHREFAVSSCLDDSQGQNLGTCVPRVLELQQNASDQGDISWLPSNPNMAPDVGQSDLTRAAQEDESQNSSKGLQEELIPVPRACWQFQNRLLSPRWAPTTEAYLTTKVLLGQIMAYPRMMAQGRRLPPFIFPRCAMEGPISQECVTTGTHQCLPETLAICCSLAQSFESRTPASEAFVWRAINAEQARLRCECSAYDTNRLLEALQAATIYLLLHAQNLESVSPIDTLSLVQTMEELSRLLHSTFDYRSEPEEPFCLDRQTWVLLESSRRTICLLFGIELLLDVIFGPLARPQCGGYSHVPLPCVGDLWEPVSNVEWSKRFRDANPCGIRKNGLNIEVLRSSRQTLEADPAESWKECATVPDVAHWCERVDEFGMLVWIAVMLETRR